MPECGGNDDNRRVYELENGRSTADETDKRDDTAHNIK